MLSNWESIIFEGLIEWIFKYGETAIYANVANVEDFQQATIIQ